jgi:cytochrome c-type biogenesis protein CcmE
MNTKMIIGVIVLLPVLAHIGYAVANSTFANYYVTVDEYVAGSAPAPVRVGGLIVPGSIQWDNGTRTMHFQIAGDRSKLDVVYRGVAPDSFRDGVTTILEGTRGPNGTFAASGIAVRCPHQYLPAS